MAPPLEPLLLSTTSVPYLLPVFLLIVFLLAARTSPNRRGTQVGYTAAGTTNCSWTCNNEDANNVGPADARIRGMVEQTVEAILPGSAASGNGVAGAAHDGGLDEASVERHPAYGSVYERHEPALSAALVGLQRALLDGADANTAATRLAALVRALGADSQVTATTTTTTSTQALPPSPTPLHDRTYEDILATAIVNKVIERCQQQQLLVTSAAASASGESPTESHRRRRGRVQAQAQGQGRRPRGRHSTGSSDSLSRSASPGDRAGDRHSSRSFVSSLEVRLGASGVSGSSGSAASANGDLDYEYDESDSWSEPLALTVEETLEETTMSTVLSDDSDVDVDLEEADGDGGLRRRRRRGPGRGPEPADKLDFFLCGINFLNKKNRVPFPELGADIVDVDVDSSGSDLDDSVDGDGASDDDREREREDDEEEDVPATVVQIASPLGTWEDNWLFQARRLKTVNSRGGGHQPVPVPMLVPNPSQDLRPLIGDVEAEETSDLSECSDDAIQDIVLAEGEGFQWANANANADADNDLAEACNTHLLQQAATDKDSELTVLYAAPDRRPAPAQRPATPLGDHDNDSGQASLESTGVHAETLKVSTDVIAIAPLSTSGPAPTYKPPPPPVDQSPPDSSAPPPSYVPIPAPRPKLPVGTSQPTAQVPSAPTEPAGTCRDTTSDGKNSDSDPEMSAPPRPGTIAAREHEKWQHAVPLPNNPYSPENIEKRLRQRGRLIDLPEVPSADRLESKSNLSSERKENGDSQRIHISIGGQPDPRRYSRDFYVNTATNGCQDSSGLDREKVSNGLKSRMGREQGPGVGPGPGRQEKKLTGDVRTSGDGDGCRGPEQEEVILPSVKELARNFVGDDQASLVDKVHSLTARSMPRAFREGLRQLSPPVTPVRVAPSPRSSPNCNSAPAPKPSDRPDPEGAGASNNENTRR